MTSSNHTFEVITRGVGLSDITHCIRDAVHSAVMSEGLATVFIRHTSASLIIQENADPAVQADLESFLRRLVPEGDPLWTHTAEGADDMPAHVRSALTSTSLGIPVMGGALALGTWQGIYLWEHRHAAHRRQVIVNLTGG